MDECIRNEFTHVWLTISTLPKIWKKKPFPIPHILYDISLYMRKSDSICSISVLLEDKLWKVECSRSWFGNIMKCSWKTPTFLDIEKRWLSEKKAEQNNSFNTIQSKILTLKRMLNTAFNDSRRNILRNAQYKTYETRFVV